METLTSFALPVIRKNDTDLQAHARSDGTDVRFYSESGTPLLFEMQSYDGTTGSGIWWVHCDSISNAENDFSIRMTYGDASLSTDASSRNVWPGHATVVHLDGGAHDSGPEARTLTEYGTATYSAGLFGNAYDSPEGSYFNLGTESDSTGIQAFSYWVKYTSAASTQSVVFESKYHYNDVCNGNIRHAWNWGGTSISANVWHYVYFFSQPDVAQIVIDGVNYGLTGGKSGINAAQTFLGGYGSGYSSNPDGIQIAEFRWTNRNDAGTASAARMLYDYNLLLNHSTYVNYSAESAQLPILPWVFDPVSVL